VRLCRREFDAAVVCGKNAIDLHPYQHMGRAHYAQALEATGKSRKPWLAEHGEAAWSAWMSPDLPILWLLDALGRRSVRRALAGKFRDWTSAGEGLQRRFKELRSEYGCRNV
jgi:3-mercaptopyruvate sulfurtransferase SseA